MDVIDVMNQWIKDFCNRDQIFEKNRRLDELCTTNKIEEQERKVWDSNPKASNRKRSTPSEPDGALKKKTFSFILTLVPFLFIIISL